MFLCVGCGSRYQLEDIKDAQFFVSSSTCLKCYKKLYKNSKLCFGDKSKYDIQVAPCQECMDNRICRSFVFHKKEFIVKS